MKILHTSDWHLGRSLSGKSRYNEFSLFLEWLATTIEEHKIDTLLVAGDIFDTTTPSNKAQALYYRFLCRISKSCCSNVVIIAGNHDSPSFLTASKELLHELNVFVVGSATENLEEELIILSKEDAPRAIICAVPYLRDKDIRTAKLGETIDDKNANLVNGLKEHYDKICLLAESRRQQLETTETGHIPIIAMGHLFTTGGKTIDGDGVRDLYVGSLAHIGKDSFPSSINYLALGHLHTPQPVGSAEHIRYSGSPIPMGFGEANQEKKVVLIEFENAKPIIKELAVPCFQRLISITGSFEDIQTKIHQLKNENSSAWLEVEYTGKDVLSNLHEMLIEILSESFMEIIQLKNRQIMNRIINAVTQNETLDDLNPEDVFVRCLDAFEVPNEDREELITSHKEILKSIHEDDLNAD
ncbi:exonuclease SbcCD subunit D C-terminal domain-containing protein [Halodesulfovibrio aestuarii]|uniref:exonuclease SbcCD subunit D C-terminal domain-containing protein n=1 Tax=Halodesulfovibrio aestuarii TaxID=126333 RepID=UPI00047FB43C